MAVPAEAMVSRPAYHQWLTRRVESLNFENMKESVRQWAAICRPDAYELQAGEQRVKIGSFETDLRHRHLAIPQLHIGPVTTVLGWQITDKPLVGVNIGGAIVMGKGVALLEGRLYADCFRSASWSWLENGWYLPPAFIGFHDFDITDGTCAIRTPDESTMRRLPDENEYFLFNSNWGALNFGHFLHDTLGQLLAFDHISALRSRRLRPILTERLKYPMQRYLFEALVGSTEEAVYLDDGPVQAKYCYSSHRPLHAIEAGVFSVAAMRAMRHRISIAAQAIGRTGESPKRVYISRADSSASDRQFANMEAAETLFAKHGFERIVVSGLSVEDTATAFRDCRYVLGVHGAGLMNALLSSEHAHLIELCDYPGSWSSIHMVVSACGSRADRVAALPPDGDGRPLIDLDKVNGVLSSLK